MEFNVNTPLVKYAILVLAAPVWWPFVKALWKEFNSILEEEGGLLGRTPDEDQLREIRREKARRESALVRELRDAKAFEPRRRPEMDGRAGFGPARPGASAPGAAAAPRRRGFGPPR
jgi:hypothetical protein